MDSWTNKRINGRMDREMVEEQADGWICILDSIRYDLFVSITQLVLARLVHMLI